MGDSRRSIFLELHHVIALTHLVVLLMEFVVMRLLGAKFMGVAVLSVIV